MEFEKRLKVVITGASGHIAYHLYDSICNGSIFGENTIIDLVLNSPPECKNYLLGIKMELEDMGFPLLNTITISLEDETAFIEADLAIFLGSFPMK